MITDHDKRVYSFRAVQTWIVTWKWMTVFVFVFLSPRGQLKDIFFQRFESIYGDSSSIKKPIPPKIIAGIGVREGKYELIFKVPSE